MIDQSAHGHALDLIAARRGLRGAVRALLPYADPRLRVSFAADPLLSAWDEPNTAAIPDPVRVAVLGIVDDALDDASHHAGVTDVNVNMRADPLGYLSLAVEDNGAPTNAAEEEADLARIARRVERLHGQWRIASAAGYGTTLSAVLPLD
jgi:signal transduction histidine kinase